MAQSTHELVVIGSGPGGYACAFRAADLGTDVTLIEKDSNLGGVCLNRGCIPSKALLHISKVLNEARKISEVGVYFEAPKVDIKKINDWKNSIISNLSSGLSGLAKRRNVNIVSGNARFISADKLIVSKNGEEQIIKFKHCVIATGSTSRNIPGIDIDHDIIQSSKDALNFNSIPEKMLIIGGGYIGLEMGTFYQSLGTKIDIAEFLPEILSEMDPDLVKVLQKEISSRFNIMTNTKVINIDTSEHNAIVTFSSKDGEKSSKQYDKILVCVGRSPNTESLNIDSTGIKLNKEGFININSQCRTLIPNIFAIGDVTGNPMLAHRATHQGKVVAEVINGEKQSFAPQCIPYVIFTDPEIAWSGPSIKELEKKKIDFASKTFPWQANGRALSLGALYGKTKIIYSKDTHKVLSVGIIGPNAGDLIGEAALAIEMGALVEDIALTIHPHPTLTETIANTAEMIEGTVTDIYNPKR